jgi:hypothetical protein
VGGMIAVDPRADDWSRSDGFDNQVLGEAATLDFFMQDVGGGAKFWFCLNRHAKLLSNLRKPGNGRGCRPRAIQEGLRATLHKSPSVPLIETLIGGIGCDERYGGM